jgi:hypothetical protein
MIKNKFFTPEEYKNMPQEQLIEVFSPLIKNLGKAFGDNRFNEDVEQDVTIELLKKQQDFTPNPGQKVSFPMYAALYMKTAAKKSRQVNISSIYVNYGTMVNYKKKGKDLPSSTENIDDHLDIAEESIQYRESEMFSILKIILKTLKGVTDYKTTVNGRIVYKKYSEVKREEMYNQYKEYIRSVLNEGPSKLVLNRKLKDLLKNTVLNKRTISD